MAKTTVTREQLEQAATMRAEGATWNAIREATGSRLGSSGWFRAWEREEIEHRPAGVPKPAPTANQPKPQASALEGESAKPSRRRAAKTAPAKKPAAKRTVRRSKSA